MAGDDRGEEDHVGRGLLRKRRRGLRALLPVFLLVAREEVRERGFNGARSVDRYTVQLEQSTHEAIHGGGNWRLGRAWEGEWNNQMMQRVNIR